MEKIFSVYILASEKNGTLYVGMTSNLKKRVWEHKNEVVEGFTKAYKIHHLVYFEIHSCFDEAMKREKQLKRWKREWKMVLIEEKNPSWSDLYAEIL